VEEGGSTLQFVREGGEATTLAKSGIWHRRKLQGPSNAYGRKRGGGRRTTCSQDRETAAARGCSEEKKVLSGGTNK